ncbi:DUF1801 domain-containing protein [Streptococcus pluranimalium]|uniref:DUF1801 domain-containing protein n=1 Tax=Streptococcus pluranimalium TaxID=82348 RepID=UPI0024158C98|nr:DUF1801 domain-containing protein [Streptococcus pluranimalium]WFM80710.1 DUF1801 domain-containing protein [Streptococcus pluranimalium]
MAKFAPTGQSVEELMTSLKTKRQQDEARQLLRLYQKVSQEEAVVWYPGIIGFGNYHYRYETGHEGDSPKLSFAPRQAKITLYIDQDLPNRASLLENLGKYKTAVGCVYVNKLADIHLDVLEDILTLSLEHLNKKIETEKE